MKLPSILILSLLLGLSACAAFPNGQPSDSRPTIISDDPGHMHSDLSPAQIQSILDDSGVYPSDPQEYQKQIKDYMSYRLLDPYSAVYDFDKDFDGKIPFRNEYWWVKSQYVSGYVIGFTVNAKNRFGGYIGSKIFKALIRNGKLIMIFDFSDFEAI